MAQQPENVLFISHSTLDRDLIEALTDCLRVGLGLQQRQYFASSLDGTDVTVGTDFKQFMRTRLRSAKVVLQIVSPAYLDSQFCSWELGASWVLAARSFPLLLSPLRPTDFSGPLSNPHVALLDARGLNDLRDVLVQSIPGLSVAGDWERTRDAFLERARTELLPALQKAWRTTAQDRLRRSARYGEATADVQALLQKLSEASQAWTRHNWPPEPGFKVEGLPHLQPKLDDVARTLAGIFTKVCGVTCNVTIKALHWEADGFYVRDMARSNGARRLTDPVAGNTDFESLFNDDGDVFFSNDIPLLQTAGNYSNTHTRPDGTLPYKSAIVWPVWALVPPEDDHENDGYLRPDLKAFLCVDSPEIDTFSERETALGAGVAALLHPLLSPYLEERDEH